MSRRRPLTWYAVVTWAVAFVMFGIGMFVTIDWFIN
jgi:hypothetical protein